MLAIELRTSLCINGRMNGDGPKPIKKANDKRWTRMAQVILFGALALSVLVLLTGWVQDLMGTTCTGLFGVTTSCFENSLNSIMFALVSPVTIVVGAIVLVILLVAGLKNGQSNK